MKTIVNKRRFLVALSAALLISAALVASCISPLDEYQDQQGDNNYANVQPVAGKGLIRIRVSDSELRTIRPNLPVVTGLYYSIQFTAITNDPVNNSKTVPSSGVMSYGTLNNIPQVLEADDYEITITAFTDSLGANPIAGWTGTATVTDGESTGIVANLHCLTGGSGTFTYSITVPDVPVKTSTLWTITAPPDDYNDNTMVIKDSGNSTIASIPLTPGTTVGATIDPIASGYYTVVITLTADRCQDRIVTYVMHIYDGLDSSLTYEIPDINQNEFTVEFNTNGYDNDNGGTFDPDPQDGLSFLDLITDPGTLLNTTHTFGGWYTGKGGNGTDGLISGSKWVFATSKVLKDTTLYAYWTETPVGPSTIVNHLSIPDIVAPVTGEAAVKTVTDTQYSGTVTWNNGNPDTFAGGTVYTAEITLTPTQGYTFTGVAANAFTVAGISATNTANSNVISVTFQATDTTINISTIGGVTAPVIGGTPTTAVPDTAQYTADIEWTGNPSTFAGGTAYTATITLHPKTGFTLAGVTANYFTVAGISATNTANSGVITITFPATDATITSLTIQGLTPPVAGVTPVMNISDSQGQYTGTISWDNSANASTPFAYYTVYTATITLSPTSGWTFTGVGANSFTVAGTSPSATNAANTGVITATFPRTAAAPITIPQIPINAPQTGTMPQTTVDTVQYSGTIGWSPAVVGTFAANETYTATITLTPKPGYTLTGVATGFFTVTNSTTVSYTEGNNYVEVEFPETAMAVTGITITFSTRNDAAIDGSGNTQPISYSAIASNEESLTFTLTNGPWTSATWTMDDVTANNSSPSGLTINGASNLLPYLVSGTHTLTVICSDGDGVSYSGHIDFTIHN